MAAETLRICQRAGVESRDWEKLYQVSFGGAQQTPVSLLRQTMTNGNLVLHTTSDDERGLLCFSLTNILDDHALLAYIATDQTKRSGGIGSKHMKQLLAQVQRDYPHLRGLVAEIESTRVKTVDEETRKQRKRRLAFYQRLGFKRLKIDYVAPSCDAKHSDDPSELLLFKYSDALECERTGDLVREIYLKAYQLPTDDPRMPSLSTGDTLGACLLFENETDAQSEPEPKTTSEPEPKTAPGDGSVTMAGIEKS